MSTTQPHAVPELDDAPTLPPAAAPLRPGERHVVPETRVSANPAGPADTDEDQDDELGGELEELPSTDDLDSADAPGEQGAPRRRAFAMPDLRPYVTADRATAHELGAVVGDVRRSTAPRIRRRMAAALRGLWRLMRVGAVVITTTAHGWITGQLAPTLPPVWRLLLLPSLAVYAVARAVALYPWSPALVVPAWLLLAVVAQRWADGHAARAGEDKPAGKVPGEKGTQAKEGGKTEGEGAVPAEETGKAPAKGKRRKTPARRKQETPAAGRSFAARLAAALERPTAEAPPGAADSPTEAPAEAPGETLVEAAAEVPAAGPAEEAQTPSRDDLVRALHTLVGGSSGVLDTALRDHLSYPSTRAVREALAAAGITHRPGVRAAGGNGPGVHRTDFPPLPPLQEGGPGAVVVAGQATNNNTNNSGEGPRKALKVDSSYPFVTMPDPGRGPAAWKIIPRP